MENVNLNVHLLILNLWLVNALDAILFVQNVNILRIIVLFAKTLYFLKISLILALIVVSLNVLLRELKIQII